eukprot:TRINITY_DN1477_c0_g1_i1.p2 TRINITY_DN1477_c0_g1~~TRINITY_DN1477_c0_g1_i1.p2  ORF type:complete len:117 (-),score=6.95 TRINITY_DN1477_c0_g1_i1:188-538(-)
MDGSPEPVPVMAVEHMVLAMTFQNHLNKTHFPSLKSLDQKRLQSQIQSNQRELKLKKLQNYLSVPFILKISSQKNFQRQLIPHFLITISSNEGASAALGVLPTLEVSYSPSKGRFA